MQDLTLVREAQDWLRELEQLECHLKKHTSFLGPNSFNLFMSMYKRWVLECRPSGPRPKIPQPMTLKSLDEQVEEAFRRVDNVSNDNWATYCKKMEQKKEKVGPRESVAAAHPNLSNAEARKNGKEQRKLIDWKHERDEKRAGEDEEEVDNRDD